MLVDQMRAWAGETMAHYAVSIFPGDHFFLRTFREKVVTTLVRDLAQGLQTRAMV
jgi:surfactin synthase thioesterase subunit